MKAYEILAQAIGIAAMFFNIMSFQQKTSKGAIGFQLFGAFLFSVNFFMLGAVVGGILNLVATVRAIVYLNREKLKTDHMGWLIGFISVFVLSYILSFTVFEKEFTLINALIELLPVIGMTAQTVGFRINTARAIRRLGLISSPAWLIYNIYNFALGAIICEVLSLGSILISMMRYDWKGSSHNVMK